MIVNNKLTILWGAFSNYFINTFYEIRSASLGLTWRTSGKDPGPTSPHWHEKERERARAGESEGERGRGRENVMNRETERKGESGRRKCQ